MVGSNIYKPMDGFLISKYHIMIKVKINNQTYCELHTRLHSKCHPLLILSQSGMTYIYLSVSTINLLKVGYEGDKMVCLWDTV